MNAATCLPSEEKTRVGLRPVGQFAELAGRAGADPLHPEAAVAPEEDQVPVRGDVFDVGRAGAGDQRLRLLAVAAHRVDVGVGAGVFAAFAAAEDDPAREVARVELVDPPVRVRRARPLPLGRTE